jgi:hypothetical protein
MVAGGEVPGQPRMATVYSESQPSAQREIFVDPFRHLQRIPSPGNLEVPAPVSQETALFVPPYSLTASPEKICKEHEIHKT